MKLVTDGKLSETYKIVVEETTRNPIHVPVSDDWIKYDTHSQRHSLLKIDILLLFSIQLPISKEICSRQNRLWLEVLPTTVDRTGIENEFIFEFVLDLRPINRMVFRLRLFSSRNMPARREYDDIRSENISIFKCSISRIT